MKNTLIELDSLHRHGMEILRFLRMRGQGNETEQGTGLDKKTSEFIGILRKINIAKLFENKRIIAISGLQGQGKTTMLGNLYDYGQTTEKPIFKGNLGRGEIFPILITEKDTDKVTYMKHCYVLDENTGFYSLTEEPIHIKSEEFEEIAHNGDNETVLLEMTVPNKYLNDNGTTGFLLLPGFELREDYFRGESVNDTYWKALLDFCVACADLNLHVITHTKLADAESSRVADKFKEMGLASNTVFLVSHSENLTEDEQKDVKERCKTIFGVTNPEVVFIDDTVANDEKNTWVSDVVGYIHKKNISCSDAYIAKARYMQNLIFYELSRFVKTMRREVDKISIERLYSNSNFDDYINVLDFAWDDVKKQYGDCLDEAIEGARAEIKRRHFELKEAGVFQKMWRSIKGHSLSDYEKQVNLIKKLLQDEEGRCQLAIANQRAWENQKLKCAENINRLSGVFCNTTVTDKTEISEGKTDNRSNKITLDTEAICAIAYLMSDKGNMETAIGKNFEQKLGIITNIAFCFYQGRLNRYVECNYDKLGKLSAGDYNTRLSEVQTDFKKETEQFKGNLTAAASILGLAIDAGADGVIDTVPAVAKLVGLSTEAACGALAAAAVGYYAVKLIKNANQAEFDEFVFEEAVLDNIFSAAKDKYLAQAQEWYENFKDTMRNRFVVMTGKGKHFGDYLLANCYLKCIEDDIETMSNDLVLNCRKNDKLLLR